MRANPSWRNRVDFQAGKTHQTHGVSAHFLVRLYYQVWWWTMLYPRIDLLQVLILEIRRVFPSASSKQRTGTVKTPHNSFQRKTTVMDCRLPWKWGTVLIEQTESVQTQAILMERERKYTVFFSLPPSLLFFLSLLFFFSFAHHITFNPYNDLWIANILHFTNKENFSVSCWCCTACEGRLEWEPRSNWGLMHNHRMKSFARFSQLSFSIFIPRIWHSQDNWTQPGPHYAPWVALPPWNGYLRNKKRSHVLFLCH